MCWVPTCAPSRAKIVSFLCAVPLWVAALALACCIPSVGQVTNGSISGRVTDPHGAFVSGADVEARNALTGIFFRTTTDSSGFFRVDLLPTGAYWVEISRKGFKPLTIGNIIVIQGKDHFVGTTFFPIGDVVTAIDAPSEAPLIDTTEGRVANTYDPIYFYNPVYLDNPVYLGRSVSPAAATDSSAPSQLEPPAHRRNWFARNFSRLKRALSRHPDSARSK